MCSRPTARCTNTTRRISPCARESSDDSGTDWRVEKVSYAAAYGGERVPALLYLPKRRSAAVSGRRLLSGLECDFAAIERRDQHARLRLCDQKWSSLHLSDLQEHVRAEQMRSRAITPNLTNTYREHVDRLVEGRAPHGGLSRDPPRHRSRSDRVHRPQLGSQPWLPSSSRSNLDSRPPS